MLYVSSDFGNTWLLSYTGTTDTAFGVSVSSSGQYITAVARGERIYTSNTVVDSALSQVLSSEISSRISGDASLSDGLSSEISSRISGDTSLSDGLSSEISSRISGDASLSDGLSSEVKNRISGDASLSAGLSSEISSRISGDASLSIGLSSEISSRISGDASLSIGLSSEISSRILTALASVNTSLSTGIGPGYINIVFPSTDLTIGEQVIGSGLGQGTLLFVPAELPWATTSSINWYAAN